MAEALSIIPSAVLRNLSDKLFEKRKNAALELEGIVKQLAAAGDHDKITAVIKLLTEEFTFSSQANHRKGGLIGLAAATVGLTSEAAQLRLLRLVLAVLREWATSVFARRMGTSASGASLILGGAFSFGQTLISNQGVRDKITSAANRYMTEVKRLPLPQSQTESVYQGFRELEESLLTPVPFERF